MRMFKLPVASLAAILITASSAAVAQRAPITQEVQLRFDGVIAAGPNETTVPMIRQPDGSYVPFTGSMPNLAYKVGDPFTVSYTAALPTKAYYDTVYAAPKPANGIYHITFMHLPSYGSPDYRYPYLQGTPSQVSLFDTKRQTNGFEEFGTGTRLTIDYNYNTDSFKIVGGSYYSGGFTGPGYVFDEASKTFVPCGTHRCRDANGGAGDPVVNLSAVTNFSISSNDVYILGSNGSLAGTFKWLFSGLWSIVGLSSSTDATAYDGWTPTPSSSSGGTPTEVPEPGMLVLFGMAAAALPFRRRVKYPK